MLRFLRSIATAWRDALAYTRQAEELETGLRTVFGEPKTIYRHGEKWVLYGSPPTLARKKRPQ